MKKNYFSSCLFLLCLILGAQETIGTTYLVGTGRGDFTRFPDGRVSAHGITPSGLPQNYSHPLDSTVLLTNYLGEQTRGIYNNLETKAITIIHPISKKRFTYLYLDLAFPHNELRELLQEKLRKHDPDFVPASLQLAATHTHASLSGYSGNCFYDIATPGYKPEIMSVILEAAYKAVIESYENVQPMRITYSNAKITSLDTLINAPRDGRNAFIRYYNNPELKEFAAGKTEAQLLENFGGKLYHSFQFKKGDQLHSLISLNGAHDWSNNGIGAGSRGVFGYKWEKEIPGIAMLTQNGASDGSSGLDIEHNFFKTKEERLRFIQNDSIYTSVWKEITDANLETGEITFKEGFNPAVFVADQNIKAAKRTIEKPDEQIVLDGDLDYELIYWDMLQGIPQGNFAQSLNPSDFYSNDTFLIPGLGHAAQFFFPSLKTAYGAPPSIGLDMFLRAEGVSEGLISFLRFLEGVNRYARLGIATLAAPISPSWSQYVWRLYRGHGIKNVAFEMGEYPRKMLGLFDMQGPVIWLLQQFKIDALLDEAVRLDKLGLWAGVWSIPRRTAVPTKVPLQIVILGNVALVACSGEFSTALSRRIENTVLEQLKYRGVKRVIVNDYSNDYNSYFATPEEYQHDKEYFNNAHVIYGKWSGSVYRYGMQKLAKAMRVGPEVREYMLDRSVVQPRPTALFLDISTSLQILPGWRDAWQAGVNQRVKEIEEQEGEGK